MDSRAIEHARVKLAKAEAAVERLRFAESLDVAEDAWSDFLLAASTIYSKLEQGAKGHGKSHGWFGRKKKERKDDDLLRYLHYARNSEEHGIERVVERDGNERDMRGKLLKPNERVLVTTDLMDKDGGVKKKDFKMLITGPHLKLVQATDSRYGDFCDPPRSHEGKPLAFGDDWSVAVAMMGVIYLRKLVEEAAALV